MLPTTLARVIAETPKRVALACPSCAAAVPPGGPECDVCRAALKLIAEGKITP